MVVVEYLRVEPVGGKGRFPSVETIPDAGLEIAQVLLYVASIRRLNNYFSYQVFSPFLKESLVPALEDPILLTHGQYGL